MGLSVVSQTLCRMDVFPAFALPIIRTRNRNFGIRGRGCCMSIGATVFGEEIDLIPSSIDGSQRSHGSPSILDPDWTRPRSRTTGLRQFNPCRCLSSVVQFIRNVLKQFAGITPD